MKRIFLYLFLLLGGTLTAKDLSDYYVLHPRANDLLYFILPMDIANTELKKDNASFDITYITSEEDATVNLTIYATEALQTDSIVFVGQNMRYSVLHFKTFYIEKEKKQVWTHRYSCRVPFSFFQQLYIEPTAWQLEIYAGTDLLRYKQNVHTWKAERNRMNEIFTVIRRNRQIKSIQFNN